MELTLHVPAEHLPLLHPFLAAAAKGRAEILRDKVTPCLRLDTLKCLNITMHGSGEHLRCPFLFPFLRMDAFNFERPETPPHSIPGPDWLVLGDDGVLLGVFVAQALEARAQAGGRPKLRLAPFARLEGPLPQTPRPGDAAFAFRKSSKNFNQPTWVKNVDRLLELPEERWGEVGISNTADLFTVFEGALDRLVTRPPSLIVDLGCGLGQIARTLAQRYPDALVVGVDASAEAIAVARKTFCLPNLKYAVVDFARALDFPQGGVDLMVSTNALPYAQDQQGSARELFGLLAPDGLLLNHCRAEESHLFWDFPRSLALPTSTQIFLADWIEAARGSDRATEVFGVPLSLSPFFFQANQATPFSEPLSAYAEARRHDAPSPYAPWHSHVLLAHSSQARAADETGLPMSHNHLERLAGVLGAVVSAPDQIKEAAIAAWIFTARTMGLLPEALGFLEAALPGAAEVLRLVLDPRQHAQEETGA